MLTIIYCLISPSAQFCVHKKGVYFSLLAMTNNLQMTLQVMHMDEGIIYVICCFFTSLLENGDDWCLLWSTAWMWNLFLITCFGGVAYNFLFSVAFSPFYHNYIVRFQIDFFLKPWHGQGILQQLSKEPEHYDIALQWPKLSCLALKL